MQKGENLSNIYWLVAFLCYIFLYMTIIYNKMIYIID
jgi:hypothetical protein